MSNLNLTVAPGDGGGAMLRQLAAAITAASSHVPDQNPGAPVVLTLNNTAAGAVMCSVQVTGAYQGPVVVV